MANKFTKSVLERQAKEMKVQSAHPAAVPDPETVSIPAAELPASESAPAPQAVLQSAPEESFVRIPTPAAKPAAKKAVQSKAIPDLADFIVRDEGRTAKNKTFYLDAAVIEGVHRAAAAQKVTDSKLVNDILKKILGL